PRTNYEANHKPVADNTSVFLARNDDHNALFQILENWCKASGAKFNVEKTEILPIGTEEYQNLVIAQCKQFPNQTEIPRSIKIARDSEPICALGAFVGNHINEMNIWTPTLKKCEQLFSKWARLRPTIEGRCALVQLIAGGETQYKTRVQGMPPDIEKHLTKIISKFIWDGGLPLISRQIMCEPHEQGGKKLLDIEIRNEAIELMKLQCYLHFGPEWPK
ncbi:hypothetical protein BDQ17DRAFT_1244540, partial [Cyathus striatus]